jgi:hypothetical protein
MTKVVVFRDSRRSQPRLTDGWFNHDPDKLDPEVFSAEPDDVDLAPYLVRDLERD